MNKSGELANQIRPRTLAEINQLNRDTAEIFDKIKHRPAFFVPAPGTPAGTPDEMFLVARRIAQSLLVASRPVTTQEDQSRTTTATQSATQSRRRRGRTRDKLVLYRRQKIQQASHAGATGLRYCELLRNSAVLETPVAWQQNEHCPKSYVEAWNHPNPIDRRKWRKKIRDEQRNALRDLRK